MQQPTPNNFYSQTSGTFSSSPFIEAFETRDPTITDINYPIQKRWYNLITNQEWILVSFTSLGGTLEANWQAFSSSGALLEIGVPFGSPLVTPDNNGLINFTSTNSSVTITGSAGGLGLQDINFAAGSTVATTYHTDSGNASPSSNILNVFGTNGITVSAVGNTVTVTGSGTINTLSDDVGASITPSANNIQLVGHVVEQGATKFSTVVAGSHLANINPMSPARWIVDPLGFNGTHTTIALAIASATSGDTIDIMDGIYTENIILKAGVNLCAYSQQANAANVTIIGKITASAAGNNTVSNIKVQTNGSNAVLVTGANAPSVTFINCAFFGTNADIIKIDISVIATTFFYNCTANASATFKIFDCTVRAAIKAYYSSFTNVDTTVNTFTGASLLECFYSTFTGAYSFADEGGLTSSGLGSVHCTFGIAGAVGLTLGGTTATNELTYTSISGTTSTALSISAGTTARLLFCTIISSAADAISGAGTLIYAALAFRSTSSHISTSNISFMDFGPVIQLANTIGTNQGSQIISGQNNPNGVVTAPKGSLYLRCDAAGEQYRNTDGATTWVLLLT